ncbi:hypothetical protein [Enterobacter sp. JBIWA005]|uniref:hypothetical protein n=1 Tax=Enterobacter sp. JBIWA005 TaxID=2831891 RepID=UPI001CBFB327|nr:hypothetical protein [Enterobacter sp. JBIWA005]UAN30805.1 hypothetical protein KGP22_16455 [Enterobacter sp. JBIWA005]
MTQKFTRNYYRIEEAANYIGCSVDYIVHLAAIGTIEACLMMDGFESTLIVYGIPAGEDESFFDDLQSPRCFGSICAEKTSTSYFLPSVTSMRAVSVGYIMKGRAFGLWAIPLEGMEKIERHGTAQADCFNSDCWRELKADKGISLCLHPASLYYETVEEAHNALHEENGRKALSIPKPTFTVQDIYISHCTLKKIEVLKDKKEPPESIYSGLPLGIQPETDEQDKNTPVVNNNKMGDFIEMLIRCVPELGDDVMDASPNRRHEILRSFLDAQKNKGKFKDMTMPSSPTIEKYFRI